MTLHIDKPQFIDGSGLATEIEFQGQRHRIQFDSAIPIEPPPFPRQPFISALAILNALADPPSAFHFLDDSDDLDPAYSLNVSSAIEQALTWWDPARAGRLEAHLQRYFERPAPRTITAKTIAPHAACFFTGGLDSTFTLLRNLATFPDGHPYRIKTAIFAYGLDVGVGGLADNATERAKFAELAEHLAEIVHSLHVHLHPLTTNVRQVAPDNAFYTQKNHSSYLASVANFLSGCYTHFRIGSAFSMSSLRPWGSHPLIDPLFGDSRHSIFHDGYEFSRIGKLRLLYGPLRYRRPLHVCVNNDLGALNCGRCFKCRRTALEFFAAFNALPEHWFAVLSSIDELIEGYEIAGDTDAEFLRDCVAEIERRDDAPRARALRAKLDAYRRARRRVEEQDWRAPIKRALRKLANK